MTQRRLFPIQDGPWVPWEIAEKAYESYKNYYGGDQTLERLAERGGFGTQELLFLLTGRRFSKGVLRGHNEEVGRMLFPPLPSSPNASSPDDILAAGWAAVACFSLVEEKKILWCFAMGSVFVEARGRTNAEALDKVREEITRLGVFR